MNELVENKKFSSIILTLFAIILSINGILTNPINYLYIGYQKYIDIAKTYENDRFVLVMPTVFSQIQDMKEFQIYKESLIIEPTRLEDLNDFTEFQNEDEFILGIKNWIEMPENEVLNKVLNYTGYDKYELLHSSKNSAKMVVYRLYK